MSAAYLVEADLSPGLMAPRDLVQLTQDVASATTVDTDVLDAMMVSAEAEVDGYLGARYALPLSPVPQLVRSLAARICRYRLYGRRPASVAPWVAEDYANATGVLKRLSDGTITLGTQPEPAQNPERAIRVTAGSPIFGRSNLDAF